MIQLIGKRQPFPSVSERREKQCFHVIDKAAEKLREALQCRTQETFILDLRLQLSELGKAFL